MLYPPLPIHHLTINHRHNRAYCRSNNPRPNNGRRVHASVLAPVRLCQAKTKKFLILFRYVLTVIHLLHFSEMPYRIFQIITKIIQIIHRDCTIVQQ